eukprot:TRINITY_DN49484_c0_g1_i1.p1 TRINITY_DN49484_c0_g1~~TRINITY_DN49484_c0_g1_i1.p1  ORF type:complete len:718 (+),score=208.94 TRINITY_DN49484_c0_g1_i1:133-2286(+)
MMSMSPPKAKKRRLVLENGDEVLDALKSLNWDEIFATLPPIPRAGATAADAEEQEDSVALRRVEELEKQLAETEKVAAEARGTAGRLKGEKEELRRSASTEPKAEAADTSSGSKTEGSSTKAPRVSSNPPAPPAAPKGEKPERLGRPDRAGRVEKAERAAAKPTAERPEAEEAPAKKRLRTKKRASQGSLAAEPALETDTEYADIDVTTCPAAIRVEDSGNSKIDGLFKRMSAASRGKPCYVMTGPKKVVYLYWNKNWKIGFELGSSKSCAHAKDAEAMHPCQPYPHVWKVFNKATKSSDKVKSMRVLEVAAVLGDAAKDAADDRVATEAPKEEQAPTAQSRGKAAARKAAASRRSKVAAAAPGGDNGQGDATGAAPASSSESGEGSGDSKSSDEEGAARASAAAESTAPAASENELQERARALKAARFESVLRGKLAKAETPSAVREILQPFHTSLQRTPEDLERVSGLRSDRMRGLLARLEAEFPATSSFASLKEAKANPPPAVEASAAERSSEAAAPASCSKEEADGAPLFESPEMAQDTPRVAAETPRVATGSPRTPQAGLLDPRTPETEDGEPQPRTPVGPQTPPLSPLAQLPHRDPTVVPGVSCLRRRKAKVDANGVPATSAEGMAGPSTPKAGRSVAFVAGTVVSHQVRIADCRSLVSLWYEAPGATVDCDNCGATEPYLGTGIELRGDPSRPKFARDTHLCDKCGTQQQ